MDFVFFLHVLGAVSVGFYLVFPFLTLRLNGLTDGARSGFASSLRSANRIGQYLLIIQFLTGGYLIGASSYSVQWIIAVIVIFILIAAFAGMCGGPLKRIATDGKSTERDLSKVRMFAFLTWVCMIIIVVLMYYINILG